MISPKQAYTILAAAGLLTPLANALPQGVSPSPSFVEAPLSTLSTSVVPRSSASGVMSIAPFPYSKSYPAVGPTGTGVGTGVYPTGGPTGISTGTGPISTGSSPNPSGKKGLAVWWGQSTSKVDLDEQCKDENVDIVILSFLTHNKPDGGSKYPQFNINTASGPSDAQKKAGADKLIDGKQYVDAIKACQKSGKKVYLSLGGQSGHIEFKSDEEAETLADQIYELFLGGGFDDETKKELRPFGDVVLDGVDFDMENKTPAHYEALTKKLRDNMKSDSSREYKIMAAPQCPRFISKAPGGGDESVPDSVLKMLDFYAVQFYNNEACEHNNTKGFKDAVQEWSKALPDTELWIAAPGAKEGATTGYIPPEEIEKEIADVKAMNLPNFGGYALWDGPVAIDNDNFDAVVRKALDA